jgi:hypothetical protein
MLGKKMGVANMKVAAVTDSTSLKDGIVGIARQADGTVQVDILALREAFVEEELGVAWCKSNEQIADPCTKSGADASSLMQTLNLGRLHHAVNDIQTCLSTQ